MLLQKLILSLTAQEKRYFVKQLPKPIPAYGILFNLILKNKEYDEKFFEEELLKAGVKNSYPYVKSYLYEAILRSSLQYRSNIKDSIYYLSNLQFLFEKGLYHNALKMIKQAAKHAWEVCDYATLIQLVGYSKQLTVKTITSPETEKLISQQDTILKYEQIRSKFKTLLIDFQVFMRTQGYLLSEKKKQQILDIKSSPLLNNKELFIDAVCKYTHHAILSHIGILLDDKKLIQKHIEGLRSIIEGPSSYKVLGEERTFTLLSTLITSYLKDEQFDVAGEKIDEYIRLLGKSNKLPRKSFIRSTYFIKTAQTHYFIRTNQPLKAKEATENLIEEASKEKNVLEPYEYVLIHYNEALVTLMLGDYSLAVKKTDKVFSLSKRLIVNEVRICLMLIEMICAYEQRKPELLKSRVYTYNNYLKNNKLNKKFFSMIYKFFNQLSKDKPIEIISEKFQKDINSLPFDVSSTEVLFIINYWLDKKKKTSN